MELSERKLKVLKAIIDDYIITGIPVGSRTLSKKVELSFSPATIRNEMADLEEMGFLDKPHTSSGRMPSDIAYRLYVDKLMQIGELSSNEMASIAAYFNNKASEVTQVLDTAAKALSEVTNHIALISAPSIDRVTIKRVQLVKIMDNKAILVLVTDTGFVTDTMITIPYSATEQQLELLSNKLTELAQNSSIDELVQNINNVAKLGVDEHKEVMGEVFNAINRNREKKEMILEGTQNIFKYPEYNSVEKAQNFLELLDTKDRLYELIGNSADMEFSIKIGRETGDETFKDMSVVTATYKVGGKNIGSFGVIGPTRMNYSKVLSVLNYVGMSLNDILECCVQIDTKDKR